MPKKKLINNQSPKSLKPLLSAILLLIVLGEGVFVYKTYNQNWLIFFLLLIFNGIIFLLVFSKLNREHAQSINNLEKAIDLLAKSDDIKSLHLRDLDQESMDLAKHINKIISVAKKKKKNIADLLKNKETDYLKLKKANEDVGYEIKQLQIIGDISERIAYSQNIPAIVEVIAGSLEELFSYTSVSYVLLDDELLTFHIRLEEPVNKNYIKEIKQKMIDSLAGLTNSDQVKKTTTEDIITGSVIDQKSSSKVGSFFNGPLVIGGKIVGVLNVADTKEGHFTETQMGVLFAITKKVSAAVESLQLILEEEKNKLNAMVSSISDGLFMVDAHLKVMIVNPALKIMLNLAIAEVAMSDVADILYGILDVRTRLQESFIMDKLIVDKDFLFGELYLRPVFSPVHDKSGNKIGAVMLLQDITKEKELQRLREDFTSMMVHELRSPLDGIKKMTELMILESSKKKNINDDLQMIKEASGSMLSLVNDLLDVAKLESGKFKIMPQMIDIHKLVNDRLEFFKALAKESKIKLSVNIAKTVPVLISCDSLRIVQVLNNFVSNALKFTSAGGVVQAQVLLHRAGGDIEQEAKEWGIEWFVNKENSKNLISNNDLVIVAITDSGAGLSSEDLPKLFNKFQQFKTAMMSEKKGTGLGLAIAKGIIEAHGGVIGVASVEGKGSSFYFALPVGK